MDQETATPAEFATEWDQPEQRRSSRGATAVEYALIVALIAGILFAVVGTLGTKTESLYTEYQTELTNEGG